MTSAKQKLVNAAKAHIDTKKWYADKNGYYPMVGSELIELYEDLELIDKEHAELEIEGLALNVCEVNDEDVEAIKEQQSYYTMFDY